MFLIYKHMGLYRAAPICSKDRWNLRKVKVGQRELRIVLRVNRLQYMLYSTHSLSIKYPNVGREHLIPLCDEIISSVKRRILQYEDFIDFTMIASVAECRHHRIWQGKGLMPPTDLENYYGHPLDPKAQQLVDYVRVEHPNTVSMDCEPPADCVQEELPY